MPPERNNRLRVLLRRAFQWRLRTLLIAVTIFACAMAGWRASIAPLRHETRIIARLQRVGAQVATGPAGGTWLRKLPGQGNYRQATCVILPSVRKPVTDADIMSLAVLRSMRLLHITDRVTRRELSQIAAMAKLLPDSVAIKLDHVEIGDSDLQLLREMRQLDQVSLFGTVTIRGREELAKARPDVACGAFGETLLRTTISNWESFPSTTIVYRLKAAARWSQACAKLAGEHHGEDAFAQQVLESYQMLLPELPQLRGSPTCPWYRPAIASRAAVLRAEMAERHGDRANALREWEQAAALADEARQLARLAYENNVGLLAEVIHTLSHWAGAHVAVARLKGDATAETAVHRAHVENLDLLIHRIGPLFWHLAQGGESDRLELAKVAHALAEAELSRLQSKSDAQIAALRYAAEHADRLLKAIDRAHKLGQVDAVDYLRGSELALAAKLALIGATADPVAAQIARNDGEGLLEARWQRIYVAELTMNRSPQALAFVQCEQARRRLAQEGTAFFDSPVGGLAPSLAALPKN